MRVAGVIIKDGKILLMRRIKNGEEYYVFPGGGVEEGESPDEALEREIKEELSLDIKNYEKVFEIENGGIKEAYYLVIGFSGTPQLGGPEKERMNENNQYCPKWLNLIQAAELKNLFPREAVAQVKRLPETHPNAEYYKAIPKKRMAAGVLLFNEENKILLVQPSYKNNWSIPGGITDANESPKQTAVRETKEEINIDLKLCKFLCVDYVLSKEKVDENLQFIFYGGILNKEQIKEIKIDKDEISDYKFVDTNEVADLLGGPERILNRRLPQCLEALKNNTAIYLENGETK